MTLRWGLVFLLVFLFTTGCATTRKQQMGQIEQLSSRLDSLEGEIQNINEEINTLHDKIDRLSSSWAQGSKRSYFSPKNSSALKLSVKQIQRALKNAGYYKGTIDGKMGPKTRMAIKEFQKDNGLRPDGIVGEKTAEKLSNYLD